MSRTIATTAHARIRQAQRNLDNDAIAFILEYGREIYSGGVLHIFLGRRDMPADPALCRRYAYLEGAVLILNHTQPTPVLLTVYRNRHGLKEIRRKTRYLRQSAAAEADRRAA